MVHILSYRNLNRKPKIISINLNQLKSSNSTDSLEFSTVCSAQESSSNQIDQEIGLVMTLTTSLLGVFLLFYGFLRDYLSFGICRLVMYTMLCVTYLLLAISRPYESDNLQEKFKAEKAISF